MTKHLHNTKRRKWRKNHPLVLRNVNAFRYYLEGNTSTANECKANRALDAGESVRGALSSPALLRDTSEKSNNPTEETNLYEGKSNENPKYIFILFIMDYMVCWSMTHIQVFHSLLRSDLPSRWHQLLQYPLVSLLGVPDRAEESLLQNWWRSWTA